MGRRRTLAAAVIVLTTVTACGREGPLASSPTNAPFPALAPIALPPIPQPDDTPVVWTQRSDKVGIRVVMTPGRPIVGEVVRFDVKMTYGDPPYRPGGFGYQLLVEEAGGESLTASCAGPPFGVVRKPAPPRAFDDNLHRKYRFFEPGPHSFSMGIGGLCTPVGGVSIERTFTVRGTRPAEGLHHTGSDGQRRVDLLITPGVTKVWSPAHLYAIFEDSSGDPFSWRISFGDGRRSIVGGPACKRRNASPDGRYERRYSHTWAHAADYAMRVELSDACLSDPRRRGAVAIAETLFVRPRGVHVRGAVELPSHRLPPLYPRKLGPLKLVVGADRCVSVERPDGERLQVLWPLGSWLLRKPLGVSIAGPIWLAGKVRKDMRILGEGRADAIPERCRRGDRALLLAPLPD
jgi:hypothetical protein